MNNQLLLIIIIIIVIFFIYNSTTKSVKQQSSSISDTFIPRFDTAATMGAAIFNNDDYVDEIFGINSNDSLVLLAQNKQIDAALFDAAGIAFDYWYADGLAGKDAFDWYKTALPFSASHDQLLGDTAHLSVDGLAGNDAFDWIHDYGNGTTTFNNDNYVDKIIGTSSNNSSALLAQNKQIDDTVLGAGAGAGATPLVFRGAGATPLVFHGTGANFLGFGDTDHLLFAGAGAGVLGASAGVDRHVLLGTGTGAGAGAGAGFGANFLGAGTDANILGFGAGEIMERV
jgi:hypothetical protein